MTEQLITFETAKLAKEKGFDGKCHYHYISDSYMKEHYKPYLKFQYDLGAEMNHLPPLSNIDFNVMLDNNLPGKSYIWSKATTAPTQSLLQKWLRDEHQIIVNSYANASGYCWESHYTPERGGTHIADSEFSGPNESGSWNTYEKALEKGLQEALKLL